MHHYGIKIARCVYNTCRICNCFTLSCYGNVLMYCNIYLHVEMTAKIYIILELAS